MQQAVLVQAGLYRYDEWMEQNIINRNLNGS